jgi:hypothetical protein
MSETETTLIDPHEIREALGLLRARVDELRGRL